MNTAQLKSKILDLLIKGELTKTWRKNNKDTENASVLLEKIRAEKENRLNEELKLKGKKPTAKVELKPVEKNDQPFEIPVSWTWCRLGDVCDTNIGLIYKPSDIVNEEGTPVLRSNNIQNGKIVYDDLVKVKNEIPEKCYVHKDDILICARNGSKNLVGKAALIEKEDMAFGAFMAIIRSPFTKYILQFLNSPIFRKQLDGVTTTTINQITQENLKNQLFPLPPLAEQTEMVRIAQNLLQMVDSIDSSYTNLIDLSKKAKSKILDLLIKGELTKTWRKNNKDTENASVLLEKIRVEKENRLNEELKAKGKKPTAKVELKPVEKNDQPFELPVSWTWCRLGDVADNILYGVSESAKEKGKYKLLRITDIQNNMVDWNSVPYTDYGDKNVLNYLLKTGDILFARTGGTVGKSYLVNECFDNVIYASYLIRVRLHEQIDYKYIKMFFESPFYWSQIIDKASGSGQPNCNGTKLANLLLPLPPLAEQTEMVRIADTLLRYIDSMCNSEEMQNKRTSSLVQHDEFCLSS